MLHPSEARGISGASSGLMSRVLIALGIALLLAGLFWPWLSRLPLFRLPGDIVIHRPGFSFYFPITSALLISLLLSLILWLLRK